MIDIFPILSEYFCNNCGQLRGSYKPEPNICGNCGSTKIIVGDPGALDKEALKAAYLEDKKCLNN